MDHKYEVYMKIPDSGFKNVLNKIKMDKREKENRTPSKEENKNISEGFKICGRYFVAIIDGKNFF
jgi:uncharacterized protein YehS (DUF1456 family)